MHGGLYYPPDSLKAQSCVAGRQKLLQFCVERHVRWRAIGKLIVAIDPEQEADLSALQARAEAAGAPQLWALESPAIAKRWSALRATAALWSPATAIVDSHGFMQQLWLEAQQAGAQGAFRHEVVAARRGPAGWQVTVQTPSDGRELLNVDCVVNAAGLAAGRVAKLAAAEGNWPTVVPVKGNYFAIRGDAPVDTLVYPLPQPGLLGLGTHLTLDLAGRARLGPDVQYPVAEVDLAVDQERMVQCLAAAQRFLPSLRQEDLVPDYAGMRPKLAVDSWADFYLAEESAQGLAGWVNLIGIESPGLTASMDLADRVYLLLQQAAKN